MRSMTPIPGNPWPHDMTITITDDAHQLLELLWVREAYGLTPEGDQPPLLASAPERIGDPADREEWETAWAELWAAATEHAARSSDAERARSLQEHVTAASEESTRRSLIDLMVGPNWRDRIGDETLGDAYSAWSRARAEERMARVRAPLNAHPERVCLDALIPAWRAGLTTVVTIPCIAAFTRVLGAHTLLVTDAQRSDPVQYSEALALFARTARA